MLSEQIREIANEYKENGYCDVDVNRLDGWADDAIVLEAQVSGFKEEVRKLKQHLSPEGEYSITRSDGELMSWESLIVSNILLELDKLLGESSDA